MAVRHIEARARTPPNDDESLPLDGVYHPLRAALSSNPTLRRVPLAVSLRRYGPGTLYGKTAPFKTNLDRSGDDEKAGPPEHHISRDRYNRGIQCWADSCSLAATKEILTRYPSARRRRSRRSVGTAVRRRRRRALRTSSPPTLITIEPPLGERASVAGGARRRATCPVDPLKNLEGYRKVGTPPLPPPHTSLWTFDRIVCRDTTTALADATHYALCVVRAHAILSRNIDKHTERTGATTDHCTPHDTRLTDAALNGAAFARQSAVFIDIMDGRTAADSIVTILSERLAVRIFTGLRRASRNLQFTTYTVGSTPRTHSVRNSSFMGDNCKPQSPARRSFNGLPGPLGQGEHADSFSVARVRPRTSKGITDLLLLNLVRLEDAGPSKKNFNTSPTQTVKTDTSSDESPGVGLSLNRSQHDAALPSTTPRQERKSSTDYSEPRHRTESNSELRRRDARVKTARIDRRVPNGLRRRTLRVKRN
ncbi:unnamed protein product, partial [Brenthis ino]